MVIWLLSVFTTDIFCQKSTYGRYSMFLFNMNVFLIVIIFGCLQIIIWTLVVNLFTNMQNAGAILILVGENVGLLSTNSRWIDVFKEDMLQCSSTKPNIEWIMMK